MLREVGNRSFPLWLLGDSTPPAWAQSLRTPLDPRHPIRHNVWTSIADVIQAHVYECGPTLRLETGTEALYIRNAVVDPSEKPGPLDQAWQLDGQLDELQQLAVHHRPFLLLCFGSFAFEFARRATGDQPARPYGYWTTKTLGMEFRRRIELVHPGQTTALPLLHRSISGGRWVQSHEYFTGETDGDYFRFVGTAIGAKLLQYRDRLSIWMRTSGGSDAGELQDSGALRPPAGGNAP